MRSRGLVARSSVAAIALTGLLALWATPAFAQTPVTVTPGFDGTAWLPRNTPIELKLSQPVPPATGRIAVLIGVTDLSAAFAVTPDGLRYKPDLLLLPAGESAVVVSLVNMKDEWTEIARFPIRVLTTGGFEKAEFIPRADLNLHGQVAEGHDAASTPPVRATYQDLTLNGGEQSTNVKGAWSLRTKSNFIGVTHQQEALRFGTLGTAAPAVDMADYLVQIDRGRSNVSAGTVMFGRNRLLLNNFTSRGLTSLINFGKASVALGAMNGTPIVGWTNPLGVDNTDHRIVAAELGVEAVPARPGAFGVQLALMEGSRLPLAGYNQGAVTDAEHSRGVGLHVLASDAAQRLRVDTGYSRSEFTTPSDPSLSPVVPAVTTTGDARYADVAFDLLHSLHIPPAHNATLVATYRHEKADPLYKSVGGVARADFFQNSIDVATTVGVLAVQVNHGQGHDNVDGTPSLLETFTRSNGANISAQLAPLFGAPTSPWLPVLTYSVIQTHLFSDQVPTGGSFTVSDLPDLMSVNQNLAAQWTGPLWHAGYRLVRSSQDNRQIGRELADFRNVNHAVQFGANPNASVTVSVDLAFETATNLQLSQDMHTRRIGGLLNWSFTKTSVFGAGMSDTRTMGNPLTSDQTNAEWHFEIAQRINRRHVQADHPLAQFFLRYTRQTGNLIVPSSLPTARLQWTVNTGLTLYVF
jgi:hypothetical protein